MRQFILQHVKEFLPHVWQRAFSFLKVMGREVFAARREEQRVSRQGNFRPQAGWQAHNFHERKFRCDDFQMNAWASVRLKFCPVLQVFTYMSTTPEAGSKWKRCNAPELCRGIFCWTKKKRKSHQLWLDGMQICAFPLGIWGKVIKQRTLCLQNAFLKKSHFIAG